jgi:simple sugar transport system permease protein
MTSTFILNWIATLPNFAAPLLLASLGLIICERSGIINLGAEGLMSVGAMSAVIVSYHTANPALAVVSGMVFAGLLAIVFAIAVVVFKANQVLSGLAVVAVGAGITGIVGRPVAHQPVAGFDKLDLGFLSDIPWIGKILFSQDILIYVCILIVIVTWWVIERSVVGLRLSAVGEDPATSDTAGVNVHIYRFNAVIISGLFCGLAGAYLSIASSQVWVEGMVAGRGWIAVALVIFARWRPMRALGGAFLFAAAEALIPRLQAIGADIPIYLMLALPYVLTLAVLIIPAVLFKRPDVSPSSLGVDYLRQDRH